MCQTIEQYTFVSQCKDMPMLRNSDSQELVSRTSYLVTAWHEFLHVFLSAYSLNVQREIERERSLSEWRWSGCEIKLIVILLCMNDMSVSITIN